MAKQNQSKNIILISYVGICLMMVVITMGLLFFESNAVVTDDDPTATPTKHNIVLTLQAEDYDDHEHHGQGQGRNAELHSTAEKTATP